MPNITLSVEDDVIRKVRKIAIDKNTTLTAMVRDYLVSVSRSEAIEKEIAMNKLKHTFSTFTRDMGKRQWQREDLYER